MALNELATYRGEQRLDGDRITAVTVYECPNNEAAGYRDGLYWALWTFVTPSVGEVRCTRTKVRYNAKPGVAWITAYFQTVRVPGQARLRGSGGVRIGKAKYDQDNKIIEGSDSDGLHIWKQTKGTNFQGQNYEVAIIETAFSGSPLGMLRSKRGKVNSDPMPNLGASAGVVLCRSYKYHLMPYGYGAIWYADIELWINTNGWNSECKRQKHVEVVQETYVLDTSLVPTGSTSKKIVLVPGKTVNVATGKLTDAPEEDITPYATVGMSDLDSMIRF